MELGAGDTERRVEFPRNKKHGDGEDELEESVADHV